MPNDCGTVSTNGSKVTPSIDEMERNGNNEKSKIKDDTSSVSMEYTDSNSKVGLAGETKREEKTPCIGYVQNIFRLLACLLAGIVFGIALEKSRVFEPVSIRQQFVFTRWLMLKVFLAAIATGQLCFSVMSIAPGVKEKFQSAIDNYACAFQTKSILTSIIGGFTLGTGMALSGACPGMVLAQVGTWTKNSIFTFIGALLGALVYGLLAQFIIRYTKPKKPFEHPTIHGKLNKPYILFGLPLALLLGVATFLMEWFIPWTQDLDPKNRNDPGVNIAQAKSWPPAVGGVLIGLLQVVLVLVMTETLGGSSSYVTIVSQWVVPNKLQETFPYLARYRCGIGNWWQVFFVGGGVLGALISSLLSGTLAKQPGVPIEYAIPGGFLLVLGARFAAGCTSGHGLSGMGLLYWLSFVTVPAMFAGGIVTSFAMQATGQLNNYQSP